jgi:hypothetical protein
MELHFYGVFFPIVEQMYVCLMELAQWQRQRLFIIQLWNLVSIKLIFVLFRKAQLKLLLCKKCI